MGNRVQIALGKLLRFLVLACVVQVAAAQGLFKGFVPDESGTNLDDPQASKAAQRQKVSPGTIIKDCPECPEMVVLPGGSFLMGSSPAADLFSNEKPKAIGFRDNKPEHQVQILSFAIGKYEVTQEQWYAVMLDNPSYNKGRKLPVHWVSWDDVQQFVVKLNQRTGQKYRLPSEAEWEYAARAGTTTESSFGNDGVTLGNYAWYRQNSGAKMQVVGQKLPNTYGLFDMQGNVWEWVEDCWHNDYNGAPTDGSAWTAGCYGSHRVQRGGSWNSIPAYLYPGFRTGDRPAIRNEDFGFRLARDL